MGSVAPGSSGVSCKLLAVLSVVTLVTAASAGCALNKSIDHVLGCVGLGEGDVVRGEVVEAFFLPLSLLSSMASLGVIFSGWYCHLPDMRNGTVAVTLIFWFASMLTAGVALKEYHLDAPRSTQLKVIEAMAVVQVFISFCYMVSLFLNVKFQRTIPGTAASKELN